MLEARFSSEVVCGGESFRVGEVGFPPGESSLVGDNKSGSLSLSDRSSVKPQNTLVNLLVQIF